MVEAHQGGFLYARDHERSLAFCQKVCALILYGTKQGVWFSWMVPGLAVQADPGKCGGSWKDGCHMDPGSFPVGTRVNVQGQTKKNFQ